MATTLSSHPLAFIFAPAPSSDDAARAHGRGEASERYSIRDESAVAIVDPAIITRLRAGDTTAFSILIADLVPPLVQYAYRVLGRRDVAEDIVQDVLARMWVQRTSLAISTTIRAYLFGAVRNAAFNTRKHERVASEHAMRSSSESSIDHQGGRLDDEITIAQLLARLPERRREAVELRFLAQLSFAEVAAVLGSSTGNAERLVARAIEALQQMVADHRG
jgi:RNA polymerase sigma-70 factor (ECF subfamily)